MNHKMGKLERQKHIDFEEIKYALEDSDDNEENADGEET